MDPEFAKRLLAAYLFGEPDASFVDVNCQCFEFSVGVACAHSYPLAAYVFDLGFPGMSGLFSKLCRNSLDGVLNSIYHDKVEVYESHEVTREFGYLITVLKDRTNRRRCVW